MKTPDSRPRFQSSNRHYHRFREQKRDGWSDWIDGSPKSRDPAARRKSFRRWLIASLVSAGVVGTICYNVL